MHRRLLPSLLVGLSTLPRSARAQGFLPEAEAVTLLRAGGLNLYFRHGITDRSQIDSGRRGDRPGQRNLSEAGRVQAVRLGDAFRTLGIPVAEVLTSEVFRARDTAELAFGWARVEPELIADDYTPGDAAEDARRVSRRLAEPVAGGNRVMVGHIVPLGLVLGRSLSQAEFPEGGAALFRPDGSGWTFLGMVQAGQLLRAAGINQTPAPRNRP